jgi:hypothetical protein
MREKIGAIANCVSIIMEHHKIGQIAYFQNLLGPSSRIPMGHQQLNLLSLQCHFFSSQRPSNRYPAVPSTRWNVQGNHGRWLESRHKERNLSAWNVHLQMQPQYLLSTSSFLMIDSVRLLEIDPVKTKGHTLSDLSRASTPVSRQATPVAVKQTTPPPPSTSPQPSVAPPQTPKKKFKVTNVIYILTAAYDRMGCSAQRSVVATTTNAPSAGMPSVPVKSVISLEKEQSLYIP